MSIVFLQLLPESLQLRKTGEGEYILAAITLGAFILLTAIYFLFYKIKLKRNAAWTMLEHFARRHEITAQELKLLRVFFNSLDRKEREVILMEKELLSARLGKFIEKVPAKSAGLVKFYDKLTMSNEQPVMLQSLMDLNEAELVGIEIGQFNRLANILMIHGSNATVSIHGERVHAEENSPASLYVYRPGLGGYLFKGVVQEVKHNTAIFCHNGELEFKGEQHLMTFIPVTGRLIPDELRRPPAVEENASASVDTDDDNAANMPMDNSGAESAQDEEQIELGYKMMTVKLSDRAALVQQVDHIFGDARENTETWIFRLDLPDSEPIVTRGRLLESRTDRGKLIIKYLDMTASDRERLYDFITKNKPVREQIT